MLITECREIIDGYKLMEEKYPELKGIKISAACGDDGLAVRKSGEGYEIHFARRVEFFRGLSYVMQNSQAEEKLCFESCGVMVDCSRNGVLNIAGAKKLMIYMALMGIDRLMLYTEDTYEVEGEKYFGYMRGRYTKEEIKELDDFADKLGIELVACIQTLAHMRNFLKWEPNAHYCDIDDILLTDSEQTYELIEKMIAAVSEMYRSRRVHIGMDEALLLGDGKYLDTHEHTDRLEIIQKHLRRVCEITDKYKLRPMIWSDTFIRAATGNEDYYSYDDITKEVDIPENLELVYWDYHHHRQEEYEMMIKKHKALGRRTMFCGATNSHTRLVPNYPAAISAFMKGLAACKKLEVPDVLISIWGDDGQELNLFYSLPVMQMAAEFCYNGDIDDVRLRERFYTCTGCDINAFYALGKADICAPSLQDFTDSENMLKVCERESGAEFDNPLNSNLTKYLLWQDPLLGTCDFYAEQLAEDVFGGILEEIKGFDYCGWEFLSEHVVKLLEVLRTKATFGVRLRESYLQGDKASLAELAEQADMLAVEIEELRNEHRRQWELYYKPFGYEVLDIRYGGLIARMKSCRDKINRYLSGETGRIDELLPERLPVRAGSTEASRRVFFYNNAASPCL